MTDTGLREIKQPEPESSQVEPPTRIKMRDLTLEKYRNEAFEAPLDFTDDEASQKQKKAIADIRKEFGKEHKLYIDGKWVKGDSGTFESRNPSSTDEVIGTFQSASSDQATGALTSAVKAFEEWQYVPAQERADYIFKAANIIRKRRLEINAWMISESGKNFYEADQDTCEAIDFLEYYAFEALRLDRGMGVMNAGTDRNRTIYTPMGAGVTISPWNFPFAIYAGMALAPVVAGNTVVAKPAPDTPKMAWLLATILEEAGLPKGVFNYVTGGDIEVGETLARHQKTRFISFTGSMKVGLHLNRIAAETPDGQHFLKRIVTEMGGKNAIVVDKDADLENAADSIVQAAYGYQGQKCSACSRVIVQKDVHDKLLDLVLKRIRTIKIGNAAEDYRMGPVINQKAVDKIMSYIEIGKEEGKLEIGGKRADVSEKGFYIEPTVFSGVDPKARIAQEEIFGPVVAFIKAKDTDEALHIANDTKFGLTGAYHSKDRKKIERVLREYKVGNLYINRSCTGSLVGSQPFGGFNMSGNDAKAGGRDYLLHFLLPKSLTYYPVNGQDYNLERFEYGKRE